VLDSYHYGKVHFLLADIVFIFDAMKKWYEIINQTGSDPEIHLFGYIYPWDEVNYSDIQYAIRDLQKTNTNCTVRINSGGGSVFEGFAIYDLFRNSSMQIHVIIEGMAASMASIVALSGDTIEITQNGRFMFHRVKIGEHGESDDLRRAADLAESLEQRLKDLIIERTGQSKEIVDSWMKKGVDLWIDAKQAKEYNLVDNIIISDKNRVVKNSIEKSINKLKPEQVYEKFYNQISLINNKIDMSLKLKLIGLFAKANPSNTLKEDDGDEQFIAAVNGIIADNQKKDKKISDLEATNKTLTDAAEAEKKGKVEKLVNDAVAAGKITEEEKAEYKELAENNFSLAEKTLAKLPGTTPAAQNNTTTIDINKQLNDGKKFDAPAASTKKYNEYTEKELKAMLAENKEQFNKLFKEEYGVDYTA
jgi:ATP-dependent Clp protease protease subunit